MEAGNGGIARVSRMTARVLLNRGVDLSVLSYLDRTAHVPHVRFASAYGKKSVFLLRHHLQALRTRATIFESAGLARARSSLPAWSQPFATWAYGIDAWEALPPAGLAAMRDAAVVIAISDYTKARFERLHGALPNMRVCWLATEDDEAAAWSGPAPDGPPSAIIVSRIDEQENYKGHAELVAAWPDVIAQVPDARLVCVGSGSGLPALRALAAASPAGANIDLLGFVPETEMPALWRRARLLAMPSRNEGFGLVYIEAMRFGLPVVASDEDAAQEINLHGETGFNVPQTDRRALVQALVALLSDRDRAAAMGAAGQARWRAHFRFSQFERRLMPLLTQAGIVA